MHLFHWQEERTGVVSGLYSGRSKGLNEDTRLSSTASGLSQKTSAALKATPEHPATSIDRVWTLLFIRFFWVWNVPLFLICFFFFFFGFDFEYLDNFYVHMYCLVRNEEEERNTSKVSRRKQFSKLLYFVWISEIFLLHSPKYKKISKDKQRIFANEICLVA